MFSFGQLGNLAAIVVTNLTFKQKQRASSLLSHCDESQVGLDEVDDNESDKIPNDDVIIIQNYHEKNIGILSVGIYSTHHQFSMFFVPI